LITLYTRLCNGNTNISTSDIQYYTAIEEVAISLEVTSFVEYVPFTLNMSRTSDMQGVLLKEYGLICEAWPDVQGADQFEDE
jgi:hypothetical protein